VGLVGSVWGGGGLLVENCTVDASIFCRAGRLSFGPRTVCCVGLLG
jgi:hypothetical protein